MSAVLVVFFNAWWVARTAPASFSESHISCPKKTETASVALDCRPIALLNTDYKVFTRVMANRLRSCIDELVADTQSGFVPGRNIHNAIDVFYTARRQLRGQSPSVPAQALLLDFAKAYDSLS